MKETFSFQAKKPLVFPNFLIFQVQTIKQAWDAENLPHLLNFKFEYS